MQDQLEFFGDHIVQGITYNSQLFTPAVPLVVVLNGREDRQGARGEPR